MRERLKLIKSYKNLHKIRIFFFLHFQFEFLLCKSYFWVKICFVCIQVCSPTFFWSCTLVHSGMSSTVFVHVACTQVLFMCVYEMCGCVCLCVKRQYRPNCWCIRGTALWSRGCAGPQYSLCRVVSHHARLITASASLLAAWQALPSALMLHASDNFISIIRPFAILGFASDRKRALVQLAHNQISPGKSLTPIKR